METVCEIIHKKPKEVLLQPQKEETKVWTAVKFLGNDFSVHDATLHIYFLLDNPLLCFYVLCLNSDLMKIGVIPVDVICSCYLLHFSGHSCYFCPDQITSLYSKTLLLAEPCL